VAKIRQNAKKKRGLAEALLEKNGFKKKIAIF
jgi:hypothetical protein